MVPLQSVATGTKLQRSAMYFDQNRARAALEKSGKSIAQIVVETGLSQRTVYNTLDNNFLYDPKLSTLNAFAKAVDTKLWNLLNE